MRTFKNELNLESTKGDTFAFGIEIEDIGQELDTCFFTCKNNFDDSTYLFQKSLNDGIELDHIEDNKYYYRIRIAPEDTEDLEVGQYYYDIQIGANDDIFTIAKGVLTIDYDITN